MKKRQIVIYMFVIFVLLCTSVYATISGEINVSASKETLKKGEEFTVTLSLSNLKADNGIDAIEGYIDIDKNILNNLTVSSINTVDGNVKINEDNILKVYDASDVNASNTDTGIVFNTNPVSGKGDYRGDSGEQACNGESGLLSVGMFEISCLPEYGHSLFSAGRR